MAQQDDQEVLAVVRASTGRRILGLGCLALLGVLLLYIALAQSPALGWQVFLIVLGVFSIWAADRMRQATASSIELTETEVRDTDGTVIAKVDEIESLDRGFFAFKPSNGFLIKTTKAQPRDWRPGLWWRAGRRIGVGGMTPGHQTKFMSEIIATILATRDGNQANR